MPLHNRNNNAKILNEALYKKNLEKQGVIDFLELYKKTKLKS